MPGGPGGVAPGEGIQWALGVGGPCPARDDGRERREEMGRAQEGRGGSFWIFFLNLTLFFSFLFFV